MTPEMNPPDIFIVDGVHEVNRIMSTYNAEKTTWERHCANVDYSFLEKTSRVKSGDGVKEYTNWYRRKGDGYLQIVSKERPNFADFYDPEPIKPDVPDIDKIRKGEHLIIKQEDFKTFKKLFKKCYCFPLDKRVK